MLDDPDNADSAYEFIEDGILLIEEGHISACVAATSLLDKLPPDTTIIEYPNALIAPSFIDTHIHFPQCDIIAAYGTRLLDWLEIYTFPAEMKFADKQYSATTAAFFLNELLRNGTTTALVFGTLHKQSVESFFTAAQQRALRMICAKVMMDRNTPAALCDTPISSRSDSQALIDQWHGKGRLGYAITPRFAPTSSPEQLTIAGELLAENPGVHMHTHLSGNPDECAWVQSLFPDSANYLDVYDRYGLLGKRSVFAHGIHLSNVQWARLSGSESAIAFCTTSNLFIGSGLFRLAKAKQHQVKVGIGTDTGGDSFSQLRTLNEAYKTQQLQGYNIDLMQMLYLATLGGARALDLDRCTGNFNRGKEADFVVPDYTATPLLVQRITTCQSIQERLFALIMLSDDRAVRSSWSLGNRVHKR